MLLKNNSEAARRAAEPQSRRAADVATSNQKIRYLLIFMIAGLIHLVSTQESFSQACCWDISVSYVPIENCCVEISAYNNDCNANFKFQYFNPVTQLWETKHIEGVMNDTLKFVICPENGESILKFRVALVDPGNENHHWCHEYYMPQEGWNMFTYESDASQCCDCPPPQNDWFKVEAFADPSCPGGCRYVHKLQIPENITCYHYYSYANEPQGVYDINIPRSLTTEPILMYDDCMPAGSTTSPGIWLQRYPNDPYPCELFAQAVCDTTPIPDTIDIDLPDPCLPDCQDPTNWDYRVAIYPSDICPGCNIQVNFVTRECDGIQQLEILALVRKNWQCLLCDKDLLMKEAFGRIIQTNPMQFKPLINGDCDTTWQVGSGSCWATYPEYYMRKGNPILDTTEFIIDSVMVSVKCDTTDCCISKFTICKDSTGLHVINNQLPDPLLICDFQTINIWGTEYFCLPNCSWMLILGGYYNTLTSKIEQKNSNSDTDYINNHSGNVIYSKGSINLEEYVQRDKHTEIKFFNLHGSQIFSREFTNANKQFDLNTLNLNSGVYFYSILIDGKIVKTEKLIIVK